MENNHASPGQSPVTSVGPSPRADLQPWKTGPETILLQCESLCNQVLGAVQTDVLNVPHHDITEGAEHSSKATVCGCSRISAVVTLGLTGLGIGSQVGIMLNDLTVHNMVIGGPAHKSGQLEVGDTILKVDHKNVTMDDYERALQGCDVPGSIVVLTVRKAEVRKP
jgi:hypothetical protein